VTGCGICNAGVCKPGVECGSPCVYNRDCANAGKCTTCVAGICGAASCNSSCTNDVDCGSTGECPSCKQNVCQKRQCGSSCYEDADCATLQNCTSCTGGMCTTMQCGSHCTDTAQCGAVPNGCNTCAGNRCTRVACGSPCSDNVDCRDAGQCTTCEDFQCTQAIPPEDCGLHRPCTSGNNNQCPMKTCSRCDPFTNTCRLGGPCGAACIVRTDCNQMASCVYCRDVCMDLPAMLEAIKRDGTPEEMEAFLRENPDALGDTMQAMAPVRID